MTEHTSSKGTAIRDRVRRRMAELGMRQCDVVVGVQQLEEGRDVQRAVIHRLHADGIFPRNERARIAIAKVLSMPPEILFSKTPDVPVSVADSAMPISTVVPAAETVAAVPPGQQPSVPPFADAGTATVMSPRPQTGDAKGKSGERDDGGSELDRQLDRLKSINERRIASRISGPLPTKPDNGGYCMLVTDQSFLPYAGENDIIFLTPSYKPRPGDRVYVLALGDVDGGYEYVRRDPDVHWLRDPRHPDSEAGGAFAVRVRHVVVLERIGAVAFA